jgi:hypothetical protein
MPRYQPPSDDVLARAAEVRAAGAAWQAVGEEVGRAARTVRRWPRLYADRWTAAYIEAERVLAALADSESVLTLRKLLVSRDEKIRWHAAKALIGRRIDRAKIELKSPPPTQPALSSDAARYIAFLDGHSDEELDAIIAELPDRSAAPAA